MNNFVIALIILFSSFTSAANDCSPLILDVSDLEKVECKLISDGAAKPKKSTCKFCNKIANIINPQYKIKLSERKITEGLKKSMLVIISDIFRAGQIQGYNPSQCSIASLTKSFNENSRCSAKDPSIIDEINSEITTEIANLTIKGSSYIEGGLTTNSYQKQTKTCQVSQADLQNMVILDIENNISPKDILRLAEISQETGKDYRAIIQQTTVNGDPSTKMNLRLMEHPLIKALVLDSPDKVIKNIDKLKTSDDIKKFIRSPEIVNILNKSENEHCQRMFKNFTEALCDPEVLSGNTEVGNFDEFSSMIRNDFSHDKEKQKKYEDNMLPLFCSQFQKENENAVDLKKLTKNFTSMNDGYDFPNDETDIFVESAKQMSSYCAEYCKKNSCDANHLAKQESSKIPKETSNILKDLFDFKSPMSEEKKKIFIASEILTPAEATSVEIAKTKSVEKTTPSPFTPEKEREIFGKVTKSVQPIAQNFSGANFNTVSSYNTNSSYNESVQEEVREKYREKSPVLPPSTAAYLKEMSSMNRDLLDRLVKERGAKDKYSMDEIKDQLAKLSKERELPLPLDQQAQFFDHEWSENAPKVMPYIPEDLKKDKSGRTIASIDTPVTGKALQDKKYQDQRNRALEQFGKGEVSNNNSTSDGKTIVMSVNNEAALKKVRLDVPTDKIEKLNLSSILGQKLVSDKEGEKLQQLIQNKQSFLLDIEGKVAFMVEYSDSKKGFDLKTLKNSLPVEVFEKIKTQISQFLISNERKHEYQALKQELKVQ